MTASYAQTQNNVLPSAFAPGQSVTAVPYDSVTDGITAHSGGGQANAVPLTSLLNRVTTVAVANDSVLLPKAVAGLKVRVSNAAANNLGVYPSTGDAINALSANAMYAQATGRVDFICYTTGTWQTA